MILLKILIFLVPAAVTLSSCQPPLPENIDTLFTDWFVHADTSSKRILQSINLSSRTLDSLATTAREKKSGYKTNAVKLFDRNGTEYTLGYAAPANPVPDSLYPLLIYLHGGIGTTRSDKGEQAYEMFRFLADTIALFLASPSSNRTAPWWSAAGLNRILTTVRYMTLHFPIDPDRIFLAGVSDGATGCYAAANTICGPFAGFMAISGYGGILPKLGIELYPSNIMQRPIYNINAGKDHLYPVTIVEQFLDWLGEEGVSVKRKIYTEEEHGFAYREKEKGTFAEIIHFWRRPHRDMVSWTIVKDLPNVADNLLSWSSGNREQRRQIVAFWKKDTLNMRLQGINSFTFISNRRNSDKLFFKSTGGEVKPLKLQRENTAHKLDLLQHLCFPELKERYVYQIDLE